MGVFSKKSKKEETSVSTESQDLSKTSEVAKPTEQK